MEYFADAPNAEFFAPAILDTERRRWRCRRPAWVHRLALADSIYAAARGFDALLWTQDADFDGLPGVRFIAKHGTRDA